MIMSLEATRWAKKPELWFVYLHMKHKAFEDDHKVFTSGRT